jgi:hypothetical protein
MCVVFLASEHCWRFGVAIILLLPAALVGRILKADIFNTLG